MKLILPMPPSVNGLYRNVPGRGRVISGLYQRWKDAADGAVWTQETTVFKGPVALTITLEDRGRYDCDNKIKAVQDFLVRHGMIDDDDKRIVRRVTAQVGDVKGCEVFVEAA
jgi:Holliday junction resolvase RusA-like endonuclease